MSNPLCTVSGSLVTLAGSPAVGTLVQFVVDPPVTLPSGSRLITSTVQAVADVTGSFAVALDQGAAVKVYCPESGLDGVPFVVPVASAVDLATLLTSEIIPPPGIAFATVAQLEAEIAARMASQIPLSRLGVLDDATLRMATALVGGGFADFDNTTPGVLLVRGPFGRINFYAGSINGKIPLNVLTGGVVDAPLVGSANLFRVQGAGIVQEIRLPGATDTDGTGLTGAHYRLVVYNGAKAYFRPTNAAHQVLMQGTLTPASTSPAPQWIVGSNPAAGAAPLDIDVTYIGSSTWKVRTFEGTPIVTTPGP